MLSFSKNNITHLMVFGIFVALTVAMTYPIPFIMGSSISDPGDSLLNTWIISRNIEKISSFDFIDFFDANIFYPYKRTLAYAEHLFTQSLIGLPIALLFKNPILTYNFVLLFSFITTGFGAYLLSRYITKNTFAALISGIIFAFNPFMFDHLGHLQIISAGGLPLSLLYLHKFMRSESYAHLGLFTVFYLLQILANGYYALYLTLFCVLYILYHIASRRLFFNYYLWLKLLIFSTVVTVVSGPFFYQYMAVRSEMGFERSIDFQATAVSYLATAPANKIYGEFTASFLTQEAALFPGIIAVFLSLFAIAYCICVNWTYQASAEGGDLADKISFKHAFNLIIWIYIVLIGYIFFLGGFDFSLRIRATRLTNPLITFEYYSAPVAYTRVPVNDEIPEVYQWLAAQAKDFSIMELPLEDVSKSNFIMEISRIYYSIYHKKNVQRIQWVFSAVVHRI